MIGEFITILGVLGINVLLGALAYRRNPKSATHLLLASLSVAILAWGIVNELSVQATTPESTLLLARLVMALAVPMSILFFLLMYTFPRASLPFSGKKLGLIALLGVVGTAVSLSPYVFTHIEGSGRNATPVPGPGMVVFFVTAVVPILLGLYALLSKNWKAVGIEKLQFRYLLVGTFVMYVGIFGLIVLPIILTSDASYVAFAPIFTIPFIAATTYAVVRHRMMDIRLALFKGLSLTVVIGAVLGVYGLLIVFAIPPLSSAININTESLAAVAALLSIPIARGIQKVLVKVTDRFLFQGRIDYKKELVSIGRDLSATINIEEATEAVVRAMRDVMRTRKVVVLLLNPDKKEFEPQAAEGIKNFQLTIPQSNPLVIHLQHAQGVLVKDELALAQERESSAAHQREIDVVSNALQWLDASVVVPLFVNKELTGLILLGDKLSGEPYLQDDVEFLNGLASQAAVNLENARLYKESLEFGRKLETEVKRATQELQVANQQLKNLDKAKSEFLSIASHQLYTPLTALRGYVAMLKEGDFGQLSEKQQPVLDILDKSADRLIDLIKGLLDISRIERGKLELNLESVDLAEMARELVQDLLPNAINKKLDLEFHEPAKPVPTVVVDKDRLRQVMLNFVDNAIKYTIKGRIDVRVGQEGGDVVFSVTDTGKGISKEDLARLFNKFTRVGGASRFHTEGTGLGLYVARQIVKEHHGEVHVDSPGEGLGSTFAMSVPAEGTPRSLKVGEKAEVVIKAAETREEERVSG